MTIKVYFKKVNDNNVPQSMIIKKVKGFNILQNPSPAIYIESDTVVTDITIKLEAIDYYSVHFDNDPI